MKNCINITMFFFLSIAFAQKEKKDLYIVYSEESKIRLVQSHDSSMVIENYYIDFNVNKSKYIELAVDNDGNLIKKIKITGLPAKSFIVKYLNVNNENMPIIVVKSKIINTLSYKEIIENTNPVNFRSIIDKFQNIYLINSKDDYTDYYVAKKVVISEIGGL